MCHRIYWQRHEICYHHNDVQHCDTVTKSKLQMNIYYSTKINSIGEKNVCKHEENDSWQHLHGRNSIFIECRWSICFNNNLSSKLTKYKRQIHEVIYTNINWVQHLDYINIKTLTHHKRNFVRYITTPFYLWLKVQVHVIYTIFLFYSFFGFTVHQFW